MEKAKYLISQNKLNKSPIIDLGNCGLINDWPKELLDCKWLEGINFGFSNNEGPKNQFTGEEDFELLAQLPALRALNLRHTGIRHIRFLKSLQQLHRLSIGKNRVTDISLIGTLQNLRHLNLEDSSIVSVEPLKSLSLLEELILSDNLIKEVTHLSNLTNLTYLDLSHNHIYRLDGLKNLTKLTQLYLNHNRFGELEDLYYLPKLIVLKLNDNKIESIHPDLLRCLPYLRRFSVHNNPITGRPSYAMSSEENCLESIKRYFGLPLHVEIPPATPATPITNSSSVTTKPPGSQRNYRGCFIYLLWTAGTAVVCGLITPGGFFIGAVIGFGLALANDSTDPLNTRGWW